MPSTIVTRPPIRRRGQNYFPASYTSTKAQITGSGGVVIGGTALVDLSTAQVASDVAILWDFDNDGDFSEALEDITEYVLDMEVTTGRDFPSQITSKVGPGRVRMTLRNDDDRFSYFNADSPLSQGSNSLKTGRKLRVMASGTSDPEPTHIASDMFDRANFAPQDDLGNAWTTIAGSWATEATTNDGTGGVQPVLNTGGANLAVVDTGVTDYYVQVMIKSAGRSTAGVSKNRVGLVYRYQDANDYSIYVLDTGENGTFAKLSAYDIEAGVETLVAELNSSAIYDDMTIAVLVQDDAVTLYRDGCPIASGVAIQTDETHVGIYAEWATNQVQPVLDDFDVWSNVVEETNGIIWTGDVVSVTPSVAPGPEKYAIVEGAGWLNRMTDAEVPTPSSAVNRSPGTVIGQMAAYCGLLKPGTGNLATGDMQPGPIPAHEPTSNALDIARSYEELEFGCMHESNEGPLKFETHEDRMARTAAVTFSDSPGAQFGYHGLIPLDSQREVINRVTVGLAASYPTIDNYGTGDSDSNTEAQGTTNAVTITIPNDVEEHDLVLVVIASTVRTRTEEWVEPLWWVGMRDKKDSTGLRVYAHVTDGTDGGETVTFYDDLGDAGGNWIAQIFRISNWYGVHATDALTMIEPVKGSNPPVLLPQWEATPNLYIAVRFGCRGNPQGSVTGSETYPQGYIEGVTLFENGITSGFDDVALQTAVKFDVNDLEDPSGFTGFSLFQIIESAVIAVRGRNGSFPPPASGLTELTFNDVQSQIDHNAIRSHRTAAFAFSTEEMAEEYAEHILHNYADDHPVFTMTFFPSKGAHYRKQAIERRIGHKIHLVANQNTGLGVESDFFIEGIHHRWSQGVTLWETTWELAPVVED